MAESASKSQIVPVILFSDVLTVALEMIETSALEMESDRGSRKLTFITTLSPLSFRILGANSECLYDSRLYLEKAANIAEAGGVSTVSLH